MNWGHGFIPRIHAGNHRSVDCSLEPPTLDGSNLDLPWGIVEAPWALKGPRSWNTCGLPHSAPRRHPSLAIRRTRHFLRSKVHRRSLRSFSSVDAAVRRCRRSAGDPEGHTNLRFGSSGRLVLMDEAAEEIVPSEPARHRRDEESDRAEVLASSGRDLR
jgi:hypothetical protein